MQKLIIQIENLSSYSSGLRSIWGRNNLMGSRGKEEKCANYSVLKRRTQRHNFPSLFKN